MLFEEVIKMVYQLGVELKNLIQRNASKTKMGKTQKKGPLENLGVDARIIFKWILNKYTNGS
jgi:hypothetical protein